MWCLGDGTIGCLLARFPHRQTMQIGCLVKDFTPSDWMEPKEAKRQGRYTQFAMAATTLALKDAQLDTETLDKVKKV